MKNSSALRRSLLFSRNGRLKHRLAAAGGQKKAATLVAGFSFLVIPARFERATVCLEGRCSIQLSYGTEGAKIGRYPGLRWIKGIGWKKMGQGIRLARKQDRR